MTRLFLALLLSSFAVAAHGRRDGAPTDSWVLVRDNNSTSMQGDFGDIELARRHLRELGPGYLWFRHGGKAYVLRDGKVIADLEAAMRPQEELGEEQSRLGQRQAELGEQQAKMGEKQAALGQRQAEIAMRRASRGMRGERDESGDREAEQEMSETQRELSKAQQTIGREQQRMGKEQQKMGDEQRRLSNEVRRKVEQVIASSLRDGTAKEVSD